MRSKSRSVNLHLLVGVFVVFTSLGLLVRHVTAQGANQDCEDLKKKIATLQSSLVDLGAQLAVVEPAFSKVDKALKDFDQYVAKEKIS